MIIYVIIYRIRNDKNFNIDISIKHNTIIAQLYQHLAWQKKRKEKENILYSISNI